MGSSGLSAVPHAGMDGPSRMRYLTVRLVLILGMNIVMRLPSIPFLLLTVGAMSLVTSRWVRGARWHVGIWLAGMVCAAGWMAFEGADPARSGDGAGVWLADPLARAGQWLALGFGMIQGLGTLGARVAPQQIRCRLASLCLLSSGIMLVSAARDLVALILSFELVQMALLTLRRGEQTDASSQDRTTPAMREPSSPWTSIALSCCLWLGLGVLVVLTGTTDFSELRTVLADAYLGTRHAAAQGSRLGLLGLGLLIIGLAARTGLVPGIGTFLSEERSDGYWVLGTERAAGQLVGMLALMRLCGFVWVGYRDELLVLLLTLGLATVVVAAALLGAGLARSEGRLSRWAAGFAMLQSGWMAIGLIAVQAELAAPSQGLQVTGQPATAGLLIFALASGSLATSGVYLLLSGLSTAGRQIEYVDELQGLGRQSPAAATGLVAVLASLAGIPLSGGFWAHWFLALAGLNVRANGDTGTVAPQMGLIVLIAAATLAQVVGFAVVLRVSQTVFLEPPLSRPRTGLWCAAMRAGLACSVGLILIGMAPTRMLRLVAAIQSPGEASVPRAPVGKSRGDATALRVDTSLPHP